jgi:putative membrane protein
MDEKMSAKNRDLIWIFVFLVALISILFALTMWSGGGFVSGMMGMMGYWWGSMFLIPMAFLGLVALGTFYLVTGFTGTVRSASKRNTRAHEIIRERYAQGEITKDQFLKMKKELES